MYFILNQQKKLNKFKLFFFVVAIALIYYISFFALVVKLFIYCILFIC